MSAPSADGAFWVFAYGSLMWYPGFEPAEAVVAKVHGWHRAMCVLSTVYRGRPEAPGLVLGLDRGGSCVGMVLRVAAEQVEAVKAALYEREMVTQVYAPTFIPAVLADGRRVRAWAFPVRRDHVQYAGHLPLDQAAAMIRDGVGNSGRALDYLANTVDHLRSLGIHDGGLERLLACARSEEPSAVTGQ
jgi:cation transport protein ChaC